MTSEMELVVDTGGSVRCIYDEDGQGRSLGRSTLVIDTGSIHGGRSLRSSRCGHHFTIPRTTISPPISVEPP